MRSIWRWVQNYFSEIDLTLFWTTVALCCLSIINMWGIVGTSSPLLIKHIEVICVGLVLMIVVSLLNYRILKSYALPVMLLYLASLCLVVISIFSPAIRNIHAWIVIGGFTFEPSELMKLSLIIVLAKYFSQRHIHIYQFQHVIASAFYLGVPLLLILKQPDLGSAAIVVLIWFGMLMAAGINRRQFFLLVSMGIVFAYLAWIFALQPYQKSRILAFINPYKDPTGIGYNIIQSEVAIGSGFWLGSGWGNGSQATLGFLPEAQSDFAFASWAEQFGLVGVVILLGLLMLLLFRILNLGREMDNNFAKLFSLGLTTFIFAHIFINAAVNTGLMPITGIPFSFLSYGGSHLLSVMTGLGLAQSIKRTG